jgi:Family of unknown function (DUF5681)
MDDNEFDEKETNEKQEGVNDYEVGYRRPPTCTRFQKGVSGNPSGRPKKPSDFDSALLREARSLVTINEKGRQIRVSKNDVLAKQLFKLAMTGNIPAARLLLAYRQNAQDKAVQLEAQRAKDLARKKPEDFTDEELMAFIRAEQEKEKREKEKKLN